MLDIYLTIKESLLNPSEPYTGAPHPSGGILCISIVYYNLFELNFGDFHRFGLYNASITFLSKLRTSYLI